MIKSELIARISGGNHHLFHKDIEHIVNVILEEIIDALARGDRVELRGFGAFTVKHRKPRTGRNPRTGAAVKVDEKFVPFFKSGRELRMRLNRDSKAPGKSAAKNGGKTAAKSGVKSGVKPGAKAGAKSGAKGTAKAPAKPASPGKPAATPGKPGRPPRAKRAAADLD